MLKLLKKHEDFIDSTTNENPILKKKNHGIHSIVDPEKYDDIFGPQCFTTCLVEHVQKINWDSALLSNSPYSKENILQYNRDNITDNFCHTANTKINNDSDIKNCKSTDCINNCGNDSYSHCTTINDFCTEDSINYLSSSAKLNKTKCAGSPNNCINKYWDNIQTIKDIYDNNK